MDSSHLEYFRMIDKPTSKQLEAAMAGSSTADKPRRPGSGTKRLPPRGYEILKYFFENETHTPNQAQKQALLDEIHALGKAAEYYTMNNVNGYFVHARRTARIKSLAAAEANSNNSGPLTRTENPYPSLNAHAISRLQKLLAEEPNPPEHEIEIWCKVLGAQLTDVQTFIKLWRQNEVEKACRPIIAVGSHLPTPSVSTTTSPEPMTPVIPPVSMPMFVRIHSADNASPSTVAPPPKVKSPSKLQLLAEAVREARSQLVSLPESLPKTTDQFLKWFEPHEIVMQELRQRMQEDIDSMSRSRVKGEPE